MQARYEKPECRPRNHLQSLALQDRVSPSAGRDRCIVRLSGDALATLSFALPSQVGALSIQGRMAFTRRLLLWSVSCTESRRQIAPIPAACRVAARLIEVTAVVSRYRLSVNGAVACIYSAFAMFLALAIGVLLPLISRGCAWRDIHHNEV